MKQNPRLYRTVAALPAWGTPENPPKEFRLFALGETHATKWGGKREVVVLTEANALAIVKEWSRRNIAGHFDRDHDFGDSRGRFDISYRAGDGLWCESIQWTPETLQKFKERKLQYHSPAFDVLKDDFGRAIRDDKGRLTITELYNVALTNFPATDNLRPLIALSQRGSARRRYNMTPEQALEKANEVIAACEGKPELADKVALLLMSEAPIAPAEEPAMEEGAKEEDAMIVQTARAVTGLKGRAVVGALQQFGVVVKERNSLAAELRAIRHTAAVNKAIEDRLLAPSKKEAALAMDPELFAGQMTLATPLVDGTQYTAKSNEPKVVEPKDLINDAMRAFCASSGTPVEEFAATWARKYPGIPFTR